MNQNFLELWGEAAYTTAGFFWMALWAFILGYFVSGLIQVFTTRKKMQSYMGKDDWKSVSLGTFFGFISSSCSFSALATTKTLFKKGAGFVSSIAFLLASTNLVIELGIVISIFLGWQFVVGEYVGGILLILFSWLLVRLIKPKNLIKLARNKLEDNTESKKDESKDSDEGSKFLKLENWSQVGRKYIMEWGMVWKDVTVGFTIAGVIAVFVPNSFFQWLFIPLEGAELAEPLIILQHIVVGPIAAFFTFIGSMGNIPLAALFFSKGVSFAGVMAFIFSDLVVFPVLRINARYYGWKMSLFILLLLYLSLVLTSFLLHYGMDFFGYLPSLNSEVITEREFFVIDYTFWLNISFLVITAVLVYLSTRGSSKGHHHNMADKGKILEKVLTFLAYSSYAWLTVGLIIHFFL